MKTRSFFLFFISTLLLLAGIPASSKENQGTPDTGNRRILVAYFSHTGNTRDVASRIHQLAGGDIFEIQSVKPYPDDYEAVKKVAKKELSSGEKPVLKTKISNIRSYDIIFIGYPIWWGTFPAPVKTFLTENDLSGKTIVPFSTHLGSGLGLSVKDISKLCPESTLLEGIAIEGNNTKNAQNKISQWLKQIKIIK